jgi:hypothetical protein
MTAKVVSILRAREAKLLWENARDSILHALEHFTEISLKDGKEDHKKWIVLSFHHAAEAVCNMGSSAYRVGDFAWF